MPHPLEYAPYVPPLTEQEHRVAETVAGGLSNRETAAHLFLSVKTVEFHLGNVYRKLGVRSRTAMAFRLRSLGDHP